MKKKSTFLQIHGKLAVNMLSKNRKRETKEVTTRCPPLRGS
jgi:hypothetical protein